MQPHDAGVLHLNHIHMMTACQIYTPCAYTRGNQGLLATTVSLARKPSHARETGRSGDMHNTGAIILVECDFLGTNRQLT
jgi:hypothetical protein